MQRAGGLDVASMGSVTSEVQQSRSQEGYSRWQKESTMTDENGGSLLKVMSTLLLSNSHKVRELEATSYHTHQVVEPLKTELEAVHQEYLLTAEQTAKKDHG